MYEWRLVGDVTLRRQPYVDPALLWVEVGAHIEAVLSGTAYFLAPIGYSAPITCYFWNGFLAGFGISCRYGSFRISQLSRQRRALRRRRGRVPG